MAHTTLLMILEDGSHRTTQWFEEVSRERVKESLEDQRRWNKVPIVAMVLVCGVQKVVYTEEAVRNFS